MSLEFLSNELLLNLFEYLNGVYLFRAFYGLNSRLNTLLIIYFRPHMFDFQSVSKHDFDSICQQYLPLITDRIISLQLSNDNETPCQIDLFLSDDCTLQRFINLQSLSFYNICSNKLLTKIIFQCRRLPHLTSLRFIECFFDQCLKIHYDFINNIWTLPKLINCQLDIHFMYNDQNFMPTLPSKSITHVSMSYMYRTLNQFGELFERTPNIRHLCARLKSDDNDQQLETPVQSITTLKLFASGLSSGIFNMLQKMPNLYRLMIKTSNIMIDGCRWQKVIVNYLPKLKVFKFYMNYQLHDCDDKEKAITSLLNSYRTSYWLVDRQWFVRCQWIPDDDKDFISLYTLPDFSRSFHIEPSTCTTRTKSTCPSEDDCWPYCHKNDDYDNNVSSFIYFAFKHICFSKIQRLHLALPFTGRLLFDLPQFDKLTILSFACFPLTDTNTAVYQLQSLIDRAPRLHSFSLQIWLPMDARELPFSLTSPSIRSLNLQNLNCSSDKSKFCFNRQQCSTFIRSSLATRCEVLYIIVKKRTIILDLIKGLSNLRVLNVKCQDDKWNNKSTLSSANDELIEWLRSRLSCTISRDIRATENIRLWIR